MDALLVLGALVAGFSLDYMTWRTDGFIYALVGALASLFTEGTLMASQVINVGNVQGACAPGPTVGPNCGYDLPAADVQFTILVVAVFAIASFLLVYTSARKEPAR